MKAIWASSVLQAVPHPPRIVAGEVAADLRMFSDAVIDVARCHLEALDSALDLDLPVLLADQFPWQGVRLSSVGAPFGPEELDRSVHKVLAGYLDPDGERRVRRVRERAADLSDLGSSAADDLLVGGDGGWVSAYLDAALRGDREEAISVVRGAMSGDFDSMGIMLDLLQPAQRQLGRLWERGEISIAHEHYVTAITQIGLSLLYPRLMAGRRPLGRSVVATAATFETHEVGIRMVSDLLEGAGWRVSYLGADVPVDDVVDVVARQCADVLALSVTMAGHLGAARELISAVRADRGCAGVKVIVGGRLFGVHPELATRLGADAWAADGREALEVCRGWAAGRSVLRGPRRGARLGLVDSFGRRA